MSADRNDREGPLDDERQALELERALEAWTRWNAGLTRGPCGWPTCPDHGWRHHAGLHDR